MLTHHEQLINAIKNGDIGKVESLLNEGTDPNTQIQHDASRFLAATHGKKIAELVLSYGIGNSRVTALHFAALYGNERAVELLLNHSANANIPDSFFNTTVLHLAVLYGDEEMVELLLKYKANVDAKDKLNTTALHFAATHENEEIVELLLKYKAGVDAKDKLNTTALHFAATHENEEIVKLLLEHGTDVNALANFKAAAFDRTNFYQTALHFATISGHKEIVKLLLEHGADVNVLDHYKRTALHFAAEHGYVEIVKLLLENYANVNILDKNNTTALHFTILYGGNKRTEIVKLLLKYGADINAQDLDKKTALYLAAEYGRRVTTKLLLNAGAKVNIKRRYDGQTAFHCAAQLGHEEIVKSLLVNNADVDIVDNTNTTALHYAAINRNEKIMELLLKHGANVNAKDDFRVTALNIVMRRPGDQKMVELLLEHGADVNIRDNLNTTAFHYAVYNQTETFFLFLFCGVDISRESQNIKNLINNNLRDYLVTFNKIAAMSCLGKLIEINKSRDKKENAEVVLGYIMDEIKQQALIKEFKDMSKGFSSDETLSLVRRGLLIFMKRLCQCCSLEHKKNAFRTGALAELLRLVLWEKGNFDLNKKIEIQDYGFTKGSNDALNLSVVCKSINTEARQFADIHFKKRKREVDELFDNLKGSLTEIEVEEPLRKYRHIV
ncbi:ankyrin repeat domain-containing protein [Candidatus Mesenet endosymbiont of Agriotes lineatus]|uniref:ankyrin repeat domain-containing protein n=1 Tax=Candidatus Mesenet endosymbiont of Agriotes lineatus TaxID=3077948 RepID=UPI0030D19033